MSISVFAPYLISYLLGVATPILVAARFFKSQDSTKGDGCLLIGMLAIIVMAILIIVFLWVTESSN